MPATYQVSRTFFNNSEIRSRIVTVEAGAPELYPGRQPSEWQSEHRSVAYDSYSVIVRVMNAS